MVEGSIGLEVTSTLRVSAEGISAGSPGGTTSVGSIGVSSAFTFSLTVSSRAARSVELVFFIQLTKSSAFSLR